MKKILILLSTVSILFATNPDSTQQFQYDFSTQHEIAHTSIKDQGRSGTCWAYATLSFLESEILKKTGKKVDLSENYIVRHTYSEKARKHVRLHGANNFSQGGQSHDVTNIIRNNGAMPESAYPGFKVDNEVNHKELSKVLNKFLEGVLDTRYLTDKWYSAFNSVLDVYFGEIQENFEYKGSDYTPNSFTKNYLQLNPDDYIEMTSYTNYPFYEKCCLEIPDNWNYNCNYYNIPIDDLEKTVDRALKNGYSVCWDADVSEDYFSPDTFDLALVPTDAYEDTIEDKWEGTIKNYVEEKIIDQELRQKTFDNFHTTDDHLMHLVGVVKDQQGNKWYKIKNSWGTDDQQYDGYYYISQSYFRLKTIAIMINKKALPTQLRTKLELNLVGKIIN